MGQNTREDSVQPEEGKKINPATKEYFLRDILKCQHCNGVVKHRNGEKRKDGTFIRYYRCYWSGTSAKDLKESGKRKCHLPYIEASALEEEVWHRLMTRLTLGRKLEELADPARYDEKLEELQAQIASLEKEQKTKERAKERIFTLLEKEQFEENEFLRKLQENKNELLKIEGQVAEAQEKLATLEEAKLNDQMLRDFLIDKKETLNRMREDLYNLAPEDKKIFVESLVEGKIRVSDGGREGERWAVLPFKMTFNRPILERFISEEKLLSLKQDATHHSS